VAHPRGVGCCIRYSKQGVMNVRHREDQSAGHGWRHAHNLSVVHAHLRLAMLMAERGVLRVAASVRVPAMLRHRVGASPHALSQIRAGVSGYADLGEEQRRCSQRADPPEPGPFHPERSRHTNGRIPHSDMRLNHTRSRLIHNHRHQEARMVMAGHPKVWSKYVVPTRVNSGRTGARYILLRTTIDRDYG
jgi:hypothetical protein